MNFPPKKKRHAGNLELTDNSAATAPNCKQPTRGKAVLVAAVVIFTSEQSNMLKWFTILLLKIHSLQTLFSQMYLHNSRNATSAENGSSSASL